MISTLWLCPLNINSPTIPILVMCKYPVIGLHLLNINFGEIDASNTSFTGIICSRLRVFSRAKIMPYSSYLMVSNTQTLCKRNQHNQRSLYLLYTSNGSGIIEPTQSCFCVLMCLFVLFICSYEATSSRKNRSLAKELTTGAVASVFLGFGSLFLLLSSGVYV